MCRWHLRNLSLGVKTMADKIKGFVISKNARYIEREGDKRTVVVFFVNPTRGEVRYSFEGIGSGREFESDFETFQKDFAPIDHGEEPKQGNPA